MELHKLTPAEGSVRGYKRKGRGQGSGKGGTSTRGHKGAKSRSGYKAKRHHEGGQMPLQMRLPKKGFKNPNRETFIALNLDQLQAMSEKFSVKEWTLEALREHNFISGKDRVKVLGRGAINAKVNLTAHAASETARKAVEAAGGSITIV
ncbi:MAG TPA: 50S ribosomal protein L15 [Saprospiraceae bacterium]|nr:50S ribosomal protein L15 [Saprospiraceae bacterium]